jgi:hypothetical protein
MFNISVNTKNSLLYADHKRSSREYAGTIGGCGLIGQPQVAHQEGVKGPSLLIVRPKRQ